MQKEIQHNGRANIGSHLRTPKNLCGLQLTQIFFFPDGENHPAISSDFLSNHYVQNSFWDTMVTNLIIINRYGADPDILERGGRA